MSNRQLVHNCKIDWADMLLLEGEKPNGLELRNLIIANLSGKNTGCYFQGLTQKRHSDKLFDMSLDNNPDLAHTTKKVWMWHPDLHKYYDEQLCYFLLAVKPFNEGAFNRELSEILKRFEIPENGICCYSLFGTFDLLLRVWLPPAKRAAFSEELTKIISNCRQRACFEVEEILKPWGFTGEKPNLQVSGNLDDIIKRVQENKASEDEIKKLRSENLLTDGATSEHFDQAKKAFIFIGADAQLSGTARGDDFTEKLRKSLSKNKAIRSSALYRGTGSAWLLAKLVVQDFYSIGKFISALHQDYSVEGITTSTFIAYQESSNWRQGDAISAAAMIIHRGRNKKVAAFLPELYQPNQPKPLERRLGSDVESLVLVAMGEEGAKSALNNNELKQFHDFLQGAIEDSRPKVFSVLFPILGELESELKKFLPRAAKCVYGDKGEKILMGQFDEIKQKNEKTQISKLSLGDALLAWNILAKEALDLPNIDPALKSELVALRDYRVEELVSLRNTVMHYGNFSQNLTVEWGAKLIDLFKLQRVTRRVITLFEANLLHHSSSDKSIPTSP